MLQACLSIIPHYLRKGNLKTISYIIKYIFFQNVSFGFIMLHMFPHQVTFVLSYWQNTANHSKDTISLEIFPQNSNLILKFLDNMFYLRTLGPVSGKASMSEDNCKT